MQKEYNCVLIQLHKVVQLNDICNIGCNNVLIETEADKFTARANNNWTPMKLIIISDKKINQHLPDKTPYYDNDGHIRLWNTGNIINIGSKEIICAYPKSEGIPSLPINFIKQYINAGCPNKINLEEEHICTKPNCNCIELECLRLQTDEVKNYPCLLQGTKLKLDYNGNCIASLIADPAILGFCGVFGDIGTMNVPVKPESPLYVKEKRSEKYIQKATILENKKFIAALKGINTLQCYKIAEAVDELIEQSKISVSDENLITLFRNNADCYADTWQFPDNQKPVEGEVVQAITELTFVKIVKQILNNENT